MREVGKRDMKALEANAQAEALNQAIQAFFVAALFAGLLFWRIGNRTELPEQSRILYLLLYSGGVITLLIVAWAGGRLVFEFGVGGGVR